MPVRDDDPNQRPDRGSAVRVHYFDAHGEARVAVILSSMTTAEVWADQARMRSAVEAYITVLGGEVLDVTVELEDSEQIFAAEAMPGQQPPERNTAFLQLVTANGKALGGQPAYRRHEHYADFAPTDFDSTMPPAYGS